MQESGHYYTVYYVSLAVGFDNEAAYKIAFLLNYLTRLTNLMHLKFKKAIFLIRLSPSYP